MSAQQGPREAFEEWFSDGGLSPLAIERSGEGYRLMSAQSAWNAWLTAWQIATAKAAERRMAEAGAIKRATGEQS